MGASGCEEAYRPGEALPVRQPWDAKTPRATPARRIVRAWFENRQGPALLRELKKQLGANASDVTVKWADYEPIDWETQYREQHPVIPVSERICICPPWDIQDNGVVIEPGIGFGTGAHPTTLQALKALDRLADSYTTALDVGCGSGILALAAAKLGLKSSGFDVEGPAVVRAKAHARLNHLDVSFCTTPIHEWTTTTDIVLANLHAELLLSLRTELIRVTRHVLITAGIMETKAQAVLQAFSPHYQKTEKSQDGEWVSFVFLNPVV